MSATTSSNRCAEPGSAVVRPSPKATEQPEWQHTGVAALLYVEHFEAAARTNLKHGEAGFILETNHAMNSGLEAMNGRVVKKYRVYERVL